MDKPQQFSTPVTSRTKREGAKQLPIIEPDSDQAIPNRLQASDSMGNVDSPLKVTHPPESNNNLDERLQESRRRRAKTFSKVTNLFNKIFAE